MMNRWVNTCIVVLTLWFCLLFMVSHGVAGDLIIEGDENYSVFVDDKTNLFVYDIQNRTVQRLDLDWPIRHLELCPQHPFVSFICYDSKRGEKFFFYDIEQAKLYEGKYYLNEFEKRWSFSGDYTYIGKSSSFLLIPTKHLRKYLESPDILPKGSIEINGHPLGLIWQVGWVADNIVYASGVHGSECWGVMDLRNQKNYLISCCGFVGVSGFSIPCNITITESSKIIRDVISKFKKTGHKEISTDFFNEVIRITKGGQSGQPSK